MLETNSRTSQNCAQYLLMWDSLYKKYPISCVVSARLSYLNLFGYNFWQLMVLIIIFRNSLSQHNNSLVPEMKQKTNDAKFLIASAVIYNT